MMKSAWFWMTLIGLIAAVDFVAFGYLIVRSSNDPTFAVEERYYEKGLDWDREMAQRRANEELGWHAGVAAERSAGGERAIRVRLTDRHGAAVAGAVVSVEAFANARASVRHAREGVTDDAGECLLLVPAGSPGAWGAWEARLRVTGGGGEVFTEVVRFEMPRVEGGGL